MPYCHECGEEIGDDDWFCQHCGAELDASAWGEDDGTGRGDPTDDRSGEWGHSGDGASGRGDSQPDPGGSGEWGDPQPERTDPQTQGSEAAGTANEEPLHEADAFQFTFKYPLSNGWKPVLISGVLLIFSWLVVPMFLLAGYGYRLSRAAALGQETAPAYEDWGGLLVDGLRYFLVSAIFAVPMYAVMGVIALASERYPLLILFALPVYFVAIYALPAFVVAFVATDSVTGAFTSGRATDYLTTFTYAKDLLIGIAINMALSFVPLVLFVTVIGWIWGYAFTGLGYAAYWGYAYYQAAQDGVVPPATGAVDGASEDTTPGGPTVSDD